MAVRPFRFTKATTPTYGNLVIDQMASKMAQWQAANGNAAVNSFELADADWRWLGENNASRTTTYKPAGTAEINDFVGSWGGTAATGSGAGFRAWEGGPKQDNTQLLDWTGRAHWDVTGDAMWYCAGPTGSVDSAQALVKYSAARDEFVHWTSGAEDDTDASLWPTRGFPHNFGSSAWDQSRRRLYKLERLSPTGGFLRWVCWANVGNEVTSATRTAWLSDRDTWLDTVADQDSLSTNFQGFQQIVYAPNVGAQGSLIVVDQNTNTIRRWNCADGAYSQYAVSFTMNTPLTGRESTDTLARRNPTLVMLGDYLYCGSFGDGLNEFWRFYLNPNGSISLETDLAACPVPMDLGGYSYPGTHTQLCILNGQIYAFVADRWSSIEGERANTGGIYKFDPAQNGGKGSWSTLHGSWLAKLQALGLTIGNGPHKFTATEIPRLGVVLLAYMNDSYETHSWLFKPPA